MIRLIIIDDNPIILKGLELRIPCEELGLELAGTYQSAEDALADLRPDRPYVVLTDIAMPDMDGLDFIELAQKRFPLCAFICITGYEKIEYMHRAIECQVISFLNKPVDDVKLRRALEKAIDTLRHKMEYNSLLSSNKLQRNSDVILRILNGEMNENMQNELMATGGLQNVASLRVLADGSQRAADAIPSDCTPEELKGMYPVNNLLFSLNEAAAGRELSMPCCVNVRRKQNGDFSRLLNELVLDAHEVVLGIRPGEKNGSGAVTEAALSQIKLLLQMRRVDDVAQCAVETIGSLLHAGYSLDELGAFMRALEQLLCNEEKTLSGLYFPVLAFASKDELKQWVRECAERTVPGESDAASALYRYIRENVALSLSLQALGRVVHMHPNYIGKLIKDRYGMSFNDLLNKLRIELSMEQLRADPEANLSTLAEQVGYSDPKYFSRVFKLRTGMSPSAYARKQKQ